MATYYWVGGSGNLNDYAGHVSTTSGGAPNAANVQGTGNDLIFDANSSAGNYAVTMTAYSIFKDLTLGAPAAGALTFAGPNTIDVYGNLVIAASTVLTWSGSLQMRSASANVTITTNGVSILGAITINTAAGVEVKQVGALTSTSSSGITLTNGTLTTDNYALTAAELKSTTDNAGRVINLGSSTVTITGNGNYTGINFVSTGGNLTLNAGTSGIQMSATNPGIIGAGMTFYDVTATQPAGVLVVSGVNTFRNLTKTGGSATHNSQIAFTDSQTITGTLTHKTTGTFSRVYTYTGSQAQNITPDVVVTITANAVDFGSLHDFQNITAAGASAPWSGASFGDFGGNTNITFPAARNMYLLLGAGATRAWINNGTWSLTSGGAAETTDYQPRGHDTAIIDVNSVTSGTGTLTTSNVKFPTILVTTLANPLVIDFGTSSKPWYGDMTLSPYITLSTVTASIYLQARGVVDQTLTQNSATVSLVGLQPLNKTSCKVLAGSDLSFLNYTSNSSFNNQFNDQGYNVTFGSFFGLANSTITKTGNWTITGSGTCWSMSGTLSDTAGTIKFTDATATTKTIAGGGKTYKQIWLSGAGSGSFNFTGNNTFADLKIDGGAKTIKFTAGSTTVVGSMTGFTYANPATITSITAAVHYLTKSGGGTITIDRATISYSTANPSSTFSARYSVDGGNNTNWTFNEARYWVGGSGNTSDTARWSLTSGGAGGASVPTSAIDVAWDSASNTTAYTVTVDATFNAKNMVFEAAPSVSGTITFDGTSAVNVYGSATLLSGMTYSGTGTLVFRATTGPQTFTSNAVSVAAPTYISVTAGVEVKLVGALTVTGVFVQQSGTFTTDGYALTATQFAANVDVADRIINLGASAITLTSGTAINFVSTGSNLTLNAGTSTITSTATSGSIIGVFAPLTFYDLVFSGTAGSCDLSSSFTCNNFTRYGGSNASLQPYDGVTVTVNGLFTISNGATTRARISSSNNSGSYIPDGSVAFVLNGTTSVVYTDFQNVTVTGTAAPLTGTSLGDAGGNSGITFPAARDMYAVVGSGSKAWNSTTLWSLTSGGATFGTDQLPRAHDTAIFDANSTHSDGTSTITWGNVYHFPLLTDCSALAYPLTFSMTAFSARSHGGMKLSPLVTITCTTGTLAFRTIRDIVFDQNGATLVIPISFNAGGTDVTLASDLNIDESLTLTRGIFNDAGYDVTVQNFVKSTTAAGTVNKTGNWELTTSGTVWTHATGLTVNDTAGYIKLTDATATAKLFSGGTQSFNRIWLSGAGGGTFDFAGNAVSIETLKIDTLPKTLRFTAGTTTGIGTLDGFTGTNASDITWTSITSAAHTIAGTGAAQSVTRGNISYSDAPSTWKAFNSTNGGNNTGWGFVTAATSALSASTSVSASVVLLRTLMSTLAASKTATATMTVLRTLLKTLSASKTTAASFVRVISKTLAATRTATGSFIRSITKRMTAALTVVPFMDRFLPKLFSPSDTDMKVPYDSQTMNVPVDVQMPVKKKE